MAEKRKVLRVVDEQGNLEQVLFETSAEQVKVADTANYYSGDNVETILQEIGAKMGEGVGKIDDVVNNEGTSLVTNKVAKVTPQNIGAIPTTEKGVANGVAQLDGSAKIPTNQLPDFLMGQVLYGGNVGVETEPINVNSAISTIYFDTSVTPSLSQIEAEEGVATLFSCPRDSMGAVAFNYIDLEKAGANISAKAIILTLDDNKNQVVYATEDFSFGILSGAKGWNVSSYDLGRAVIVTSVSQQSIWNSWVSGVNDYTTQSPVKATLSNNAMKKLGVTSTELSITNDTANKTGYVSNEGIYYIATTNFSFADKKYNVGDWLISTGNAWAKIDNTDAVTGVKGSAENTYRTGNINISPTNIGLGNVDNTADKDKSVAHSDTSDSATKASKLDHNVSIGLSGDVVGSHSTDFSGAFASFTATIADGAVTKSKLANSGVEEGVYTAVSVDTKGRVVDGGSVIEWGTSGQNAPSANLMVNGIFFELQ